MYNVKRGQEAMELASIMIEKVRKNEGRVIIQVEPNMYEMTVICEIDNKYMLNYINPLKEINVVALLRKSEVDAILKPFTNEVFLNTVNKNFDFGGF